MKDAEYCPIARGKAADTANSRQMISYSDVEEELNRNEHLNLNLE